MKEPHELRKDIVDFLTKENRVCSAVAICNVLNIDNPGKVYPLFQELVKGGQILVTSSGYCIPDVNNIE